MQESAEVVAASQSSTVNAFIIMRTHWKIAVLTTAVFMAIILTYVFTAQPIYEGKASIKIGYHVNQAFPFTPQSLTEIVEYIRKNQDRFKTFDERAGFPKVSGITREPGNVMTITVRAHSPEIVSQNLTEVVDTIMAEQHQIYKQLQTNWKETDKRVDALIIENTQALKEFEHKGEAENLNNKAQVLRIKERLHSLQTEKVKLQKGLDTTNYPSALLTATPYTVVKSHPKPIASILLGLGFSLMMGVLAAYTIYWIKRMKS